MKYKHNLAAAIILWSLLVVGALYLLVVVNGYFREIPEQLNNYQGYNISASGIRSVLNLLLAASVGLGLYGLGALWHAMHIAAHHYPLMDKLHMRNSALEKKVSELTAELTQTVAQLSQETAQRRLLAEQLKTHTTTDALTGLLNRGTGMALLVNQLHMSERYQWPLTIWLINLDNLKQVKDRFGYECADQMVIEVSRSIQNNIRKSDTLFRMGDDELMVILPQCSIQDAVAIRDEINIDCQLGQLSQYEWQAEISHGLAEYQPGCRIRVTDFVQQASLDAHQNKSSPSKSMAKPL